MAQKMFVFRPSGYGEDTYMVMAEDQEAALTAVLSFYTKAYNDTNHNTLSEMISSGYYTIEIYDVGDVACNSNA